MTIIERTDSSRNVLAAAQSLRKWYNKKHTDLIQSDIETLHLAEKEMNPVKKKELLAQSRKIGNELDELNERMRNTALARVNENKVERGCLSGSEQRISIVQDVNDTEPPSGRKKLFGFAAIYEKPTTIAGLFIERIEKGAFADVVKDSDTRFLLNHDPNFIYGRTTNKTLRLYDNSLGLYVWNDLLPNDIASEALFQRVLRRDISGMSFAFSDVTDDWVLPSSWDELPIRTILKIGKLYDTSVVVYPQYPETSISAVIERKESVDEMVERFDQEEYDDWSRQNRLRKLQKQIDVKLNFEQRFEYDRHVRLAERLKNYLNEKQ